MYGISVDLTGLFIWNIIEPRPKRPGCVVKAALPRIRGRSGAPAQVLASERTFAVGAVLVAPVHQVEVAHLVVGGQADADGVVVVVVHRAPEDRIDRVNTAASALHL